MIAAWMGYTIAFGALLTAAALALEWALRLNGRPARVVWALALVLSVAAPFVLPTLGGETPESASVATAERAADEKPPLLSLPGPLAEPGPLLERLDIPLTVLWAGLSTLAALTLLGGAIRLNRYRRDWERTGVDGTDVFVSENFGPAVVGILAPEIVLPRWALALPAEDRGMVLSHESEHRRAGDIQLLVAGLVVALILPWNVPLWFQLRRLRRAVEVDCDQRVIRGGAERLAYGALLLRVGSRMTVPLPLAATLHEPRTLLERRIEMIARRESTGRVGKTVLALGLATVLVFVACETPPPTDASADFAEEVSVATMTAREASVEDASASVPPIILVNGERLDAETDEFKRLDPSSIERIEVVKGAAAAELLGEDARGGVIQIFTKDGRPLQTVRAEATFDIPLPLEKRSMTILPLRLRAEETDTARFGPDLGTARAELLQVERELQELRVVLSRTDVDSEDRRAMEEKSRTLYEMILSYRAELKKRQ